MSAIKNPSAGILFSIIHMVFALLLVIPSRAHSITIYTSELPGLFTEKKDGAYDKVLEEVQRQTGLKFTTMLVPAARGRIEFLKRKECYTPSNKTEYMSENAIVASTPFNQAKIIAFTRKGEKRITSLGDLLSIRIAKVRGLRIDVLADIGKTGIAEVAENKQLLALLKSKRIDAFVTYAPEIFYVLKKMPNEAVNFVDFDNRFVISSAENSIVCYLNTASGKFLTQFNLAIEKMRRDGTLKTILGELYLLD